MCGVLLGLKCLYCGLDLQTADSTTVWPNYTPVDGRADGVYHVAVLAKPRALPAGLQYYLGYCVFTKGNLG